MPARAHPTAPRRPTRVLMTVHSAQRGGAQFVALGQARALRHEYDLVVAVGAGPLRAAFAEVATAVVRGPTCLPLWGASRRRWALQIGRAVPDAVRFAWLVRRQRIDVVVVNSTVLLTPVLGARLARVPVIVHAQEAPTSAAARRLFRAHGALSDTVVAISPWTAQAFDGVRAHVVANPVGIAIPRDPEPRELFAADPVRLVVVGTVDRHKRQDLAVAAVRVLRDRGLEAELTIVGLEADSAYAAEVRAQARDLGVSPQVRFSGPTSDVATVLLAADALLLPAGEVTPLVLMEAMALRTPVIAARIGSIPDVVSDEASGLLVAPGDPAALAGAVDRLRRERGLAQRITESGRRRVEEHFDEIGSHRRLSAEIGRLAAGCAPDARAADRVSAPAQPAAAFKVVRRRLGASWRRTLAAVLRWRLRMSPAGVAGALVYHQTFRVPPAAEQVLPGITAAVLERHLRHLRRSYELVQASRLHRAMVARRRGRRIPIAVTFDDDLASHLDVAAPLLRDFACPATFFLTGAGLDRSHGFWWQRMQAASDRGLDPRPAARSVGLPAPAQQSLTGLAADVERLPAEARDAVARALSELIGDDPPAYRLTRPQVHALAQAGFEIGFHTRDHRPLAELTDDELVRALEEGRDALEAAAGSPLTTIAYPHGRADQRVVAAVRAAGYTDGFAGPGRPITARSDRLLLGRAELLLEDSSSFELAVASELRAAR